MELSPSHWLAQQSVATAASSPARERRWLRPAGKGEGAVAQATRFTKTCCRLHNRGSWVQEAWQQTHLLQNRGNQVPLSHNMPRQTAEPQPWNANGLATGYIRACWLEKMVDFHASGADISAQDVSTADTLQWPTLREWRRRVCGRRGRYGSALAQSKQCHALRTRTGHVAERYGLCTGQKILQKGTALTRTRVEVVWQGCRCRS